MNKFLCKLRFVYDVKLLSAQRLFHIARILFECVNVDFVYIFCFSSCASIIFFYFASTWNIYYCFVRLLYVFFSLLACTSLVSVYIFSRLIINATTIVSTFFLLHRNTYRNIESGRASVFEECKNSWRTWNFSFDICRRYAYVCLFVFCCLLFSVVLCRIFLALIEVRTFPNCGKNVFLPSSFRHICLNKTFVQAHFCCCCLLLLLN